MRSPARVGNFGARDLLTQIVKRFLVLVAILLSGALACVLACASLASYAASPAPPRARLRSFVCQRALDPPGREVSVTAVMRPVPGTAAMALRFDLLQRLQSASSFSAVRGGDLGAWISPSNRSLGQRPGDTWVLAKPVVDLPAPATYRFRVTFRWTGADGKVLQSVERQTRSCREPELRADLLVRSIQLAPLPNHPRQAQYTAVVRNAGSTAAGPFQVQFAPADGVGVKSHTVERLQPHATIREVFVGRACTALDAPTVTADPQHAVDDFDLSNNALQVPATCPESTTR
jgi:hypothetical protein